MADIFDEPTPAGWKPGDIASTLKNLPGSVVKQGANVLQSAAGLIPRPRVDEQGVHTSVPTLEAMGHVLGGLYGKLTGEPVSPESEAAANALISHYKRTYGTSQGFHDALVNDPASIAMDVASVAAPIEGGLRAVGGLAAKTSLAGSVPALTRGAELADAVSDVTNPLKAVRAVTAKPREAFAQRVYSSALKPTKKHPEALREPAAAEGIASGVRAGRKLEDDIWSAMQEPMQQVDQGVDYYQKAGHKVDLGQVVKQNVGTRPPSPETLGRPHTQEEIASSGPVYSNYGGNEIHAQHNQIDSTLGDITKGVGHPGKKGAPASELVDENDEPLSPGMPDEPPYLGPVDFDRANDIAKKSYRDIERSNKTAEFKARSGPMLDTQKAMASGIRKDMKQQADIAHAADPNAPDISTPLKRESNLMTLQDMMDKSTADFAAATRTLPMGGLTPLYSGVRAAVSPSAKTRAGIALSPKSPMFNRPIGAPGMPTWSDVGDVGAKAGAMGTAGNMPQQGDIFDEPAPFADGGVVAGPPVPYKAGDARKIKGTTYVRDAMGQWHPQPFAQ